MERDRIRQEILEWESRLLAMGAQRTGTIRFWIRQQFAADGPAPENREYCPTCGGKFQMHLWHDSTYDASGEHIDMGTGRVGFEDDRR